MLAQEACAIVDIRQQRTLAEEQDAFVALWSCTSLFWNL
jgi:hypothetical protein